jgi:hypothetical protein
VCGVSLKLARATHRVTDRFGWGVGRFRFSGR